MKHATLSIAVPLMLLMGTPVLAGTKQSPAAPQLSDVELEAVNKLFQQFADAFAANDADACMRLFAGAAGRQKIQKSLQVEFQQSQYKKFEILQVIPDDSDRQFHTVDVSFRFKLASRDGSRELENSTNHSFIIRKMDDGTFLLVSSTFFDGLGLKSQIDLVVDALLLVMAIFIMVSFWVWMGCEAFRMRPRERLWGMFVYFVPVLGSTLFFFFKYLPRQLGRGRISASEFD